ncbi:MAG: hypothetical protein AAGD22_08065 [Verrucomicrobiota bacterium]
MHLKTIITLVAVLLLPFALVNCASTNSNEDPAADVDDIMVDVSDALPGLGPGPMVNDRGVEADERFY